MRWRDLLPWRQHDRPLGALGFGHAVRHSFWPRAVVLQRHGDRHEWRHRGPQWQPELRRRKLHPQRHRHRAQWRVEYVDVDGALSLARPLWLVVAAAAKDARRQATSDGSLHHPADVASA